MDFNQFLFKYFVYYPIIFIRGQNVPYHLRRLNNSQFWPSQQIEQFQLQKLQKLINQANNFVPFYKKDRLKNINDLKDIEQLAFLTKEMVKQNPDDFRSSNNKLFLSKKTTGGSTGEPLTILKTPFSMARELAANWRGYSWAGIQIGDRQARFWGIPLSKNDQFRAKLIDFIANRKRCQAFAFDDEVFREYTKKLCRFKPNYLHGYVSMLTEYADFLNSNSIPLPFDLKCIITTSEVLTEHYRNLLKNTFSTKIYNEYGSAELGVIAHECEYGSLHITSENLILEIVDGAKVCEPGQAGEIVCTDLNNYAMPLIRYRTGDFAALSPKKCKCGRTLPVLEKLYGRAYDIIKNKNGKLFHGEYFMYIFEEAKRKHYGVKKFQVIQFNFDHFKIKLIPQNKKDIKNIEAFILNKIRKDFDPEANVDFEYVENIERAPSGKMRVIIGIDQITPS